MKKFIYTLIIGITMFIGVNGVEALNDELFTCKYSVNFHSLNDNAKDTNTKFEAVVFTDEVSISSFSSYDYTEKLAYKSILYEDGTREKLEKKFKEKALLNNNYSCPTIIFTDSSLGNSDKILMRVNPAESNETGKKIEVNGTFVPGRVTESKEKIVCNKELDLNYTTNEQKVTFTFFKKGTTEMWRVAIGTEKVEELAGVAVSLKGHLFQAEDNELIEEVFSTSSCNFNFKCDTFDYNNVNVFLTSDKPSIGERCNYRLGVQPIKPTEPTEPDPIVTNGETIKLVKQIYNIIKILIPILIIALSIVDFLTVILISDDKNYKSAWDKFIKRLIIGVIFFLVPIIVSFILEYSGIETEQSYLEIFK